MVNLPPRTVDAALLAQRLMIAVVFFTSGWSHAKDPAGRGKSIGMSKQFTLFLGVAEMAGALGVAFGVLAQWAALGLILVMLGAIQKKSLSGTPGSGAGKHPAGTMTSCSSSCAWW